MGADASDWWWDIGGSSEGHRLVRLFAAVARQLDQRLHGHDGFRVPRFVSRCFDYCIRNFVLVLLPPIVIYSP